MFPLTLMQLKGLAFLEHILLTLRWPPSSSIPKEKKSQILDNTRPFQDAIACE